MGEIHIQVDEASLEQSKSGAITGVIFFDFGAYHFPENGWNDFVVVVLCWWLTALKGVAGGAGNAELRFMDGPLYVRMERLDNGLFSVASYDEGAGDTPEFADKVQFVDILSCVLRAAKTVHAACVRNGWKSPELSELKRLIVELS